MLGRWDRAPVALGDDALVEALQLFDGVLPRVFLVRDEALRKMPRVIGSLRSTRYSSPPASSAVATEFLSRGSSAPLRDPD